MEKKIVIITDSDFPSGSASAKFLRLLSYGLSENGWLVKVYLQKGKSNRIIEQTEIKGCIKRNIEYKYFAWNYRPQTKVLRLIDSLICSIAIVFNLILLKLNKNIDYVLVYNHYGIQNLASLVPCKILRIPTFSYTADWLTKDISFPKKSQIFKFWNHQFKMKFVNKWYEGIISTSTFINNYYKNSGINKKRLLILPSAIEKPIIYDPANENQYPKKQKIRIAFCGKPTWTNGGEMLLEIFSKVVAHNANCELLIMGDQIGNTNLLKSLKNKSEELGIRDKVIFTGMVSYERVSQLLQTSDLFILPRPAGQFAEAGFPTKLGEYLATKKPVVVSKVGDIPKYLQHKIDIILCESGNIEDFVNNILWLISHPTESNVIANNGYDWAIQNLDYKNNSKLLMNFLLEFK